MSYPPPQYPPGQYPPGQYPPGQYPPGPEPPPGQPVERRRGCRGCLIGCLATFLLACVAVGVAVAFGVYTLRQLYPTAGTVWEAAGCVVMRTIVENAEKNFDDAGLAPDEKEAARRELQQLVREFEGQCGPLP